jgi:multidrug resistance efflux pump
MTVSEVRSKRGKTADEPDAVLSLVADSQTPAKRLTQITPFLITLVMVAFAGLFGWAMWDVYMGAPWTRDSTVRAYVVTIAPEVAGRIVELPVADNKYVRKGDLLMVIDPINYAIAVSQAEAAVQQAQANVQNGEAQINVQQAQVSANQAELDRAQAALVFARSRRLAIRPWRRKATAPFRMPSSSRPNCISRKQPRRRHNRTSTRLSGKSNR